MKKPPFRSSFRSSEFKKSSFCNFDPVCVQVAIVDDAVAVKDSKHPNKAPHVFSKEEWAGFIAGVKNGEFDV